MLNLLYVGFFLLGCNTCFGVSCVTVSDGSWNDPAVWDCGCDIATCDTLIVSHAMQAAGPVTEINAAFLKVELTGSIIGEGQLSVFGTMYNYGMVDAVRLWFFSSGTLRNYNGLVADVFINVKDTCFNYGSIQASDSLVNGVGRNMHNWGTMVCGNFHALGGVHNLGSLATVTANKFWGTALNNEGAFYVDTKMQLSIVYNYGSLDLGSFGTYNHFENYGTMLCSDSLVNGVPGFLTNSIIGGNAVVQARIFVNPPDCNITGSGSLCISETSINEGSIEGNLHICDTSPTSIEWPYLDINTGTVVSFTSVCEVGYCSVGIDEQNAIGELVSYPNPSSGDVTIELGTIAQRVSSVTIFDAIGRLVGTIQGSFSERTTLHRNDLEPGTYEFRVGDRSGSVIAITRVIFVDQ